MEAIIFVGIQAAGKSSFYTQRFFDSHLRISLDLLRTRNRESRLLELCLETQLPFVVDNTNPSKQTRQKYIEHSRLAKYKVIGYYFQSRVEDCLGRNSQRVHQVPDVAIYGTAKRLEIPAYDEGFDELWYVSTSSRGFEVQAWNSTAAIKPLEN